MTEVTQLQTGFILGASVTAATTLLYIGIKKIDQTTGDKQSR